MAKSLVSCFFWLTVYIFNSLFYFFIVQLTAQILQICSSSMKYSKHNMRQNKQTKKKKKTQLHFRVEGCKFTLEVSHSLSPQITRHIEWKTLAIFDIINISCFK